MKQAIEMEVYNKELEGAILEGFLIDTVELNKMYHDGMIMRYTGNVMDERNNVYMTFIDEENNDNWFLQIKY
jgi:hypothetical protein